MLKVYFLYQLIIILLYFINYNILDKYITFVIEVMDLQLKRKSEKVRLKNKERKEKYFLYTKSGFKDEINEISANKNNLELYNLNRIKKEI